MQKTRVRRGLPGISGCTLRVPQPKATGPESSHPRSNLQASGSRERRASGSPSPPLEERVGERRPVTLLDAAVRGDLPAGCRTSISGMVAENDGLLSMALSSKGGEGVEFGHSGLVNPKGCQKVAGGRRGFGGRRPPGNGAGDLLHPGRGARPASEPDRAGQGVALAPLPGCSPPDAVSRWSFPPCPERPPATLWQPCGLASASEFSRKCPNAKPAHSSKGGEGNSAVASEHRVARMDQPRPSSLVPPFAAFGFRVS